MILGEARPPPHRRGQLPDRARLPARTRRAPVYRQRGGVGRAPVEGGRRSSTWDATPRPRLRATLRSRWSPATQGSLRTDCWRSTGPHWIAWQRGTSRTPSRCTIEEIPLLDASRAGPRDERNRIVTRVARAAAAVGANQPARALVDLDYVDKRLDDPTTGRDPPVATRNGRACGSRLPLHRQRTAREREPRARPLGRGGAGHGHAQGHPRRTISRGESRRDRARRNARGRAAGAEREPASRPSSRRRMARSRARECRGSSCARTRSERQGAARRALARRRAHHVDGGALVPDLQKRIETASTEMATRHEPSLQTYERWFENLWASREARARTSPTLARERAPHCALTSDDRGWRERRAHLRVAARQITSSRLHVRMAVARPRFAILGGSRV